MSEGEGIYWALTGWIFVWAWVEVLVSARKVSDDQL